VICLSEQMNAPAFDFYPERWTHGTRHMSKIERCDYLDLLCHQWTDDGLPNDLELIARLLGYKKASQIPLLVLAKFPIATDGKRRNERLEQERQKQQERFAKKSLGAAKTNAKRWGQRVADESLSDQIATPERVASESPPPTTDHRPINTPLPPEPPASPSLGLEIETVPSPIYPAQVEIGQWFGRRPTTRWSEKELKAWAKVPKPIDPDDWQALRWFYTQSGCGYLRRDILTLLNNWTGEIDRAKNFNPDDAK